MAVLVNNMNYPNSFNNYMSIDTYLMDLSISKDCNYYIKVLSRERKNRNNMGEFLINAELKKTIQENVNKALNNYFNDNDISTLSDFLYKVLLCSLDKKDVSELLNSVDYLRVQNTFINMSINMAEPLMIEAFKESMHKLNVNLHTANQEYLDKIKPINIDGKNRYPVQDYNNSNSNVDINELINKANKEMHSNVNSDNISFDIPKQTDYHGINVKDVNEEDNSEGIVFNNVPEEKITLDY